MNLYAIVIISSLISFSLGYLINSVITRHRPIDKAEKNSGSPGVKPADPESDTEKDRLLYDLLARGEIFNMDLSRALKEVTRTGSGILNCGRVSVWFYNDDYSILRCIDLYDSSADQHRSGDELTSSEFPSYTRAHTAELFIAATDVYDDPRTREIPSRYFRENRISSLLDVPLWCKKRIHGVLSFEHTGAKRNWNRDDERLSLILANIASLCIETETGKRTERALSEAEMQLRMVGDSLTGGMIYQVVIKKDGTRQFLYVSEGVKALHNLTPDEVISDPASLYGQIIKEDLQMIAEKEEYSLKNMCPFDVEMRYRDSAGGIKWSRLISHPRLMKNGDILFDGIEIDITGRKKNEALLRENEENLRITLDSIGDAVISTDNTGRIVRMNNAAVRLTGWNPAEAKGLYISEVFRLTDSEHRERNIDPVEEVIRTGEIVFLEEDMILHSRDGVEHRIMDSAAPIINDSGVSAGVVLVFRDVTEQYRLQHEADQNALIFRTIFETSPYSIVIQSAKDSRYVLVNPAFLSVTGLKEEEIIGKTMAEIGRGVDREDEKRAVEQLRNTGKIDNMVIKSVGNKGYDNYTLFSSRIIEFNGDACILTVTVDVTETRRMQEQLNQAQKMDAIGQLAGGVAHDFNNMLGGILGAAELLQLNAGDNLKLLKYIHMIRTTAERAASLTGKLLAFSRKNTMEELPVKIHRVITDAAELLGRTIDKKISINLNLDSGEDTVSGDFPLLMNVFLNLGINSGHAMPEGGELYFKTRGVELDEHYCRINSPDLTPGKFILVEVQDTGCGIAAEHIGMIFNPFFTTKEKGKGTGMGLASVYGTVRQHQGMISVYSEPGRGTVFHLYFPLVKNASDDDRCMTELFHGTGRILVIDDEEIMRLTAKELLQYLGYDVILASDGKEGVEIFRSEHQGIDLVLLDMVMPVMNGRECFAELKKINPSVRVIVSSGFVVDEYLNELRDAGLSGFIRKPFQTSELSRVIARVLYGCDDEVPERSTE